MHNEEKNNLSLYKIYELEKCTATGIFPIQSSNCYGVFLCKLIGIDQLLNIWLYRISYVWKACVLMFERCYIWLIQMSTIKRQITITDDDDTVRRSVCKDRSWEKCNNRKLQQILARTLSSLNEVRVTHPPVSRSAVRKLTPGETRYLNLNL